jgi:hypothetical protein
LPKDREVIFISNVEEKYIRNLNGYRIRKSEKSYYQDVYYMYLKQTHILIQYMTRWNGGDLRISFNPTKSQLLQENSINVFIEKLSLLLKDSIDLERLVYYNRIMVSKDETCINIIMPSENINPTLKAISKIKLSRYKVDTKYLNKGTVNFYTGKEATNTGIKIRIYDKTKDLREKGDILNEEKLNGMGVLRIELVSKRAKIRREFNRSSFVFLGTRLLKNSNFIISKKQQNINDCNNVFYSLSSSRYYNKILVKATNDVYFNIENKINNIKDNAFSQYKTQCFNRDFNLKELEYMLCNRYEHDVFYLLINGLYLNKKITTRKKLFKKIERTKKLSRREKATARMVVKYLNDERMTEDVQLSEYSIKKYTNFILSLGYHYVYSDEEIGEVIKGDISIASNLIDINDYIISYGKKTG